LARDCLKTIDDGRDVIDNGLPNDVLFKVVITVDETVPCRDYYTPRDLRMIVLENLRDPAASPMISIRWTTA
jgi:hypothetical protein